MRNKVLIEFTIFVANIVHGVAAIEKCSYFGYLGEDFKVHDVQCDQFKICQRTFTISYIDFPPYFYRGMVNHEVNDHSRHMQKQIHRKIRRCCGRCGNITDGILYNSIAEVALPTAMNGSDFLFPFFAPATTDSLYGYTYLPVVNIPQMMYVTNVKKTDVEKIFVKVLPITLMCVLFATVAGFICWLLETKGNKDEFSR